MKRRDLLQFGLGTALVGISRGVLAEDPPAQQVRETSDRVHSQNPICLFTDLVDDYGCSYAEIASMLQQLKVAGPDLTVRPGGVILPDRVAEELPKAAAIFKEHGLSIPMLSTGIVSATDKLTRPTLTAMSQLGIRYYKLGYYHYGELNKWEAQLDTVRKDLTGLAKLGEELGVVAGFHNHAGSLGGANWDLFALLEPLTSYEKWIGSYFDPAHATIEGGALGWKLGFQRLASRLKMIAIKDFIWEKVGGQWKSRWCPLGEGMVRWSEFFALLASIKFEGPISLHIEYDPGGKTKAARLENSLAAAERDLKFLRNGLKGSSSEPR